MLHFIMLPFEITSVLFAIIVVGLCLKFRRAKARLLIVFAAAILFIPSCIGIMSIVDHYRYGRFEYSTAADIPKNDTNRHVSTPAGATDIVLYINGSCHRMKFSIAPGELMDWVAELRGGTQESPEPLADNEMILSDQEKAVMAEYERKEFESRFDGVGWIYDPAMRQYKIGSYRIWHVPDSDVAYLSSSGYW